MLFNKEWEKPVINTNHVKLDCAIMLLNRDGWTQHTFRSGNGRCLVGTLIDAGVRTEVKGVLADRAYKAVFAALAEDDNLAMWNDHPCRTKEDVVALLEKAKQFC